MPSAVSGLQAVRGLQERTARAFPAERVENADGWWLRHAPGCSWWVGTVLPHGGAGPDEQVRRVAEAEEFYARWGTAARFQISPGACPAGLDARLAERGYRRRTPVSLQAAPTARVRECASAGTLRVRLDDRPTRTWFEAWHAVNSGDARAEWDMLGRVEQPSAYVRVLTGDAGDGAVAVGRAVADTGWAGVFGMATRPAARGRGAGRSVLAALADWAGAHGAGRMYLQAACGNTPALRLYERAGFRPVCVYHYRTAG